jgi:hypothetical protein
MIGTMKIVTILSHIFLSDMAISVIPDKIKIAKSQ